MKIIDNKGRLFGLINILDLAVLIIVGGILFFGFSRMNKNTIAKKETKSADITYEVKNVRQVTVDAIKVGDPIYHYDKGTYIGKIISKDVKPYAEEVEYEGKFVMSDIPEKYVVTIVVQADIEETDQYYSAGGEQSRVGAEFRIKNKEFASWGTVMNIEVHQ